MNGPIGTDEMLDRIEELEAKLAKEIEISNQRGNHIEFVLLPQMSDLQFQLKDLQAKLEEAVGSLEKLARLGNGDLYGNSDGNMIARITLAKLKGEKQNEW